MGQRVNYSGLVIAGIGFFLTRFTVSLALYENPVRFFLAGIVPLTLGLGLAAFGVALTVADVEKEVVRTVATWCVIGAFTMLVLVVLTIVGSSAGEMPAFATIQSRVYLSTFLIGGSVGGTMTGLYASLNRRQRDELERQANRLEVLNRILRHEVLNAVTVIRGYAPMVEEQGAEAVELIQDRSDDIEATIEEVQYLARSARSGPAGMTRVDLAEVLSGSVERAESEHPDAVIQLETPGTELTVSANPRLAHVSTQLLAHAIAHAEETPPEVSVTVENPTDAVRVHFEYTGPALTDTQRDLLESGDIGEYDDPSSGFDLNVTRLLVESYGGTIETARRGDRTRITVVLSKGESYVPSQGLLTAGVSGVRPAVPTLVVTLVAALIAGVGYGFASETMGGSVAGIGVFYGIANPAVGWITHEFHSIVFGFVFAGLVSLAPARYHRGYLGHLGIGLGWGVVLWLGAAGVIAPLWLRLLGIPATLPSLSGSLFVAHVVWGAILGLLTAWGYRHVTPRLARVTGATPAGEPA